jgi:hypothetical protein
MSRRYFPVYDLGYIGHKAEQLQKLFPEYKASEKEALLFLRFENYSHQVFNAGTLCYTNCFKSENYFRNTLMHKLLEQL